jgi:hypothetical protein
MLLRLIRLLWSSKRRHLSYFFEEYLNFIPSMSERRGRHKRHSQGEVVLGCSGMSLDNALEITVHDFDKS